MRPLGGEWMQLLRYVIGFVPILIVWVVAIAYCFARYRENPKGALFLGMAIAIAFAGRVVAYLLPFFFHTYGPGSWFILAYSGIQIMSQVAVWVLITMAVFARPMHYDFSSGPVFDEESR
jgi:hypothetical protein